MTFLFFVLAVSSGAWLISSSGGNPVLAESVLLIAAGIASALSESFQIPVSMTPLILVVSGACGGLAGWYAVRGSSDKVLFRFLALDLFIHSLFLRSFLLTADTYFVFRFSSWTLLAGVVFPVIVFLILTSKSVGGKIRIAGKAPASIENLGFSAGKIRLISWLLAGVLLSACAGLRQWNTGLLFGAGYFACIFLAIVRAAVSFASRQFDSRQ